MSLQFLFGERPLPYFKLPDAHGREIVSWDFRQRKPLVVAFVHDNSCATCHAWSANAARLGENIRQCGGELLVIMPLRTTEISTQQDHARQLLADPHGALLAKLHAAGFAHTNTPLLIVDRYGEIAEVYESARPHAFPSEEKILEALEFVERQCPE